MKLKKHRIGSVFAEVSGDRIHVVDFSKNTYELGEFVTKIRTGITFIGLSINSVKFRDSSPAKAVENILMSEKQHYVYLGPL